MEWVGKPALVRWVELKLIFAHDQEVLFENVSLNRYPRIVEEKVRGGWNEQIRLPMSAEAIRKIEEKRGGSDLNLNVEVRFSVFELPDPKSQAGLPVAAFDGTSYQSTNGGLTVAQSEWVKLLGTMGWDEVELFELSRLPLEEDEDLKEALDRLRGAQAAFRRCDYRAVLNQCRAAFESAFLHHGDDPKDGAATLFAQVFEGEPAKAAAMDPIVKSISATRSPVR